MTSWATTAKPRPASPARTASMVALSASRLVCLAIAEIRLTTLPISAEEAFSPSTLLPAAAAAWPASSVSVPASRTWRPISSEDFANSSVAVARCVAPSVACARHGGELLALAADRAEHVGGRARAAAHRVGGALHVADHRGEIDLDQVDGLADRRHAGLRLVDARLGDGRRRLDGGQGLRVVAAAEEIQEAGHEAIPAIARGAGARLKGQAPRRLQLTRQTLTVWLIGA